MFSRSVPERINAFLKERKERPYCDSCIQESLGLKWRQQVQLITATLCVTSSFRRERGLCCNCKNHKQVIAAVNASPADRKAAPVREFASTSRTRHAAANAAAR
jgi:hypothetical protein